MIASTTAIPNKIQGLADPRLGKVVGPSFWPATSAGAIGGIGVFG